MPSIPLGPSKLLFNVPNINVTTDTGVALVTMVPFLIDFAVLVNNDTASNALLMRLSLDGGVTWLTFFRVSAVAAGQSAQQPYGGLYIPSLSAHPNGVTTTGMGLLIWGWPIT